MDSKEAKFQIPVDSIRGIVHKIKEKGAGMLDPEELVVCLTAVGFQQVCKGLGAEWTSKHEKEAIERIKASKLEVPWLFKKQTANTQYGPLLVHCTRGDIAKVTVVLDQVKDIIKKVPKEQREAVREAVDSTKKTGLHIAAKEGFEVLAEYLLEEGLSANSRDRELKIPLHYSCIGSAEAVSSILLKKSDILAKDSKYLSFQFRGCMPIHYAVCGTASKTVQDMLSSNPQLSQVKDFNGKSPLHYAVMSSTENQIDIMRMLIENGARVNDIDDDGRTPLHYASEYGKSRCIPILLKSKANPDLKDKLKKSPIELACNQRIKKLLLTYGDDKKLTIPESEQKQLAEEFDSKLHATENQKRIEKMKGKAPETSAVKPAPTKESHQSNAPVLAGEVNQVSTWLRQKLFVLLKKLQESGVKAKFHVKRPYIFTGSWLENVESIEDLYTIFGEVSGPEVGMRVFNVLCPYEKKLPTGLGKMEALEGFFGQNWFGTKPVEEIRANKGQQKLKRQLQEKDKIIEEMKIELRAQQTEISRLEDEALVLNDQLRQYKRMEEDVRKEKVRSAQQYSEILKLTNQNEQLKKQVAEAYSGDDEVEKLNKKLQEAKNANDELKMEIESLKSYEAAARRKCGKLFLKAVQNPEKQLRGNFDNLYDDDSILRLYELLEGNPPSLLKRLQAVDRNGDSKLSAEEFTTFLERLKMLPQDILALHRVVGFVSGRKHLSFDEFKEILEARPQLRVQWEKKLINKLKNIIQASEVGTVERLFQLLDVDGSDNVSLQELRAGLETYNIFLNQNDLSNLYSLLDADKSGAISLQEFLSLLGKEESGKVIPSLKPSAFVDAHEDQPKQEEREETDKDQADQEENGKAQEEEDPNKQLDEQQDREASNHESVEGKQKAEDEQQHPYQEENEQPNEAQQQEEQNAKDESPANEEEPEPQHSSDQRTEEQNEEQIGPRVTGVFKLQVRFCENLVGQEELEKVAISFQFGKEEIVKVGDFSKKKWEIAVKFQVSNKLETTIPSIRISVWKNRDFQEANYLGEAEIDSKALMESPDEWVVNGPVQLEARAFEKEVSGSIGVQARWKETQEIASPE